MVKGAVTYLEKQTEGEAGDNGIIIDHVFEKNRTAGLRVVFAKAAIEGCW